jgi:hypothetical protein
MACLLSVQRKLPTCHGNINLFLRVYVLEILRILPRAGHGRHFLSHVWGFRGDTRRSMKDKREVKSGAGTERSGMGDPRDIQGDLWEI